MLAQEVPGSVQFWNNLTTHCGKAFEGEIVAGGKEGDGFTGEKLVMHVRACGEKDIRIPFFVGEDKSRTWVLTMRDDNLILLKHDHRLRDGSDDEVTMYGGLSPNTGLAGIQFFPADQFTSDLIAYASNNVWWITLDDTSFTYNLRRVGSDRFFSVKFNLTKEVAAPGAPWGSED
ncbi:hypothetical protein GCM10007383_18660 [Arenibacter certesii]|uniref:Uncharacterized protein n=2 Tax=Arenibacter certesii TaxID=228955 RepID=A0A918MLB7_9FLAO|nr:hypothetical protein GCM10007383_18660 [Arenibacter certesii]